MIVLPPGKLVTPLLSGLLGKVIVPFSLGGKVTLPSGFTVIGPLPLGLTNGLSCGLLVILPSIPGNSTPPSGLGRTSLPFGVVIVPSGLIELPGGAIVISSFPVPGIVISPPPGKVTLPSGFGFG